jgi:hypothetical protein
MTLPEGYGLEVLNAVQPSDTSKYAMKWDGEWHITIEVFRDLGLAFAAVLLLIYVLVVGWFQSFTTPLLIMAAIPFSLVGILPAHAAMGAFFTATSMIGFRRGRIVVRNSIILGTSSSCAGDGCRSSRRSWTRAPCACPMRDRRRRHRRRRGPVDLIFCGPPFRLCGEVASLLLAWPCPCSTTWPAGTIARPRHRRRCPPRWCHDRRNSAHVHLAAEDDRGGRGLR